MSGSTDTLPCRVSRWMRLPAGGLGLLLVLGGCDAGPPVRIDVVDVHMVAQARSWHASYRVAGSNGRMVDVPTGREVHVPLGAGVRLTLASHDYISSFTVQGLDLRQFAAPSRLSQLTFLADRVGRYEVRGDEMCGLPHTDRARGWLVIEGPEVFQAWVRKRIREARL